MEKLQKCSTNATLAAFMRRSLSSTVQYLKVRSPAAIILSNAYGGKLRTH
ncbi:hypothetical protein [uncultured Nostoc sp.]